jgi:PKHD-type hydroxylase
MLKNNYYYFQSALSGENCEKIINLGVNKIKDLEKKNISTEGKTLGNNHKQAMTDNAVPLNDETLENIKEENTYVRDSKICWLNDKWLYELIWPFIKKANIYADWNFDVDYADDFQFTMYGVNQFYGWHQDGDMDKGAAIKRFYPGVNGFGMDCPSFHSSNSDFIGKVRKISLTINLNLPSDYEGGNLKFDFGPHSKSERYYECKEIRPRGSIIVFPSFLYHQVTPVTKGTRYSLVLWVLGKPFK